MSETEKITINLSVVDLGKIDLMVQEGFYSNRTDFVRTSVRNLLIKHEPETQQALSRRAYGVGIFSYNRRDLEALQEKLEINIIGLLIINHDVSVELAIKTIKSIRINGVLRASKAIKEALADRIK